MPAKKKTTDSKKAAAAPAPVVVPVAPAPVVVPVTTEPVVMAANAPTMTRHFGAFPPVANDGMIHTVAPETEGETVKMMFPKEVLLTVDYHKKILFPAGVQRVPVEHANHPWLTQNGAVRS